MLQILYFPFKRAIDIYSHLHCGILYELDLYITKNAHVQDSVNDPLNRELQKKLYFVKRAIHAFTSPAFSEVL